MMGAGAGGTQYGVLTSTNQGGGNKKQGLVSTTNSPVSLDAFIRVRGGGHNRNWLFCMNQLGGVGRRWGQASGPGNRGGVSANCQRLAYRRRQEYPPKPCGAQVRGWGAGVKYPSLCRPEAALPDSGALTFSGFVYSVGAAPVPPYRPNDFNPYGRFYPGINMVGFDLGSAASLEEPCCGPWYLPEYPDPASTTPGPAPLPGTGGYNGSMCPAISCISDGEIDWAKKEHLTVLRFPISPSIIFNTANYPPVEEPASGSSNAHVFSKVWDSKQDRYGKKAGCTSTVGCVDAPNASANDENGDQFVLWNPAGSCTHMADGSGNGYIGNHGGTYMDAVRYAVQEGHTVIVDLHANAMHFCTFKGIAMTQTAFATIWSHIAYWFVNDPIIGTNAKTGCLLGQVIFELYNEPGSFPMYSCTEASAAPGSCSGLKGTSTWPGSATPQLCANQAFGKDCSNPVCPAIQTTTGTTPMPPIPHCVPPGPPPGGLFAPGGTCSGTPTDPTEERSCDTQSVAYQALLKSKATDENSPTKCPNLPNDSPHDVSGSPINGCMSIAGCEWTAAQTPNCLCCTGGGGTDSMACTWQKENLTSPGPGGGASMYCLPSGSGMDIEHARPSVPSSDSNDIPSASSWACTNSPPAPYGGLCCEPVISGQTTHGSPTCILNISSGCGGSDPSAVACPTNPAQQAFDGQYNKYTKRTSKYATHTLTCPGSTAYHGMTYYCPIAYAYPNPPWWDDLVNGNYRSSFPDVDVSFCGCPPPPTSAAADDCPDCTQSPSCSVPDTMTCKYMATYWTWQEAAYKEIRRWDAGKKIHILTTTYNDSSGLHAYNQTISGSAGSRGNLEYLAYKIQQLSNQEQDNRIMIASHQYCDGPNWSGLNNAQNGCSPQFTNGCDPGWGQNAGGGYPHWIRNMDAILLQYPLANGQPIRWLLTEGNVTCGSNAGHTCTSTIDPSEGLNTPGYAKPYFDFLMMLKDLSITCAGFALWHANLFPFWNTPSGPAGVGSLGPNSPVYQEWYGTVYSSAEQQKPGNNLATTCMLDWKTPPAPTLLKGFEPTSGPAQAFTAPTLPCYNFTQFKQDKTYVPPSDASDPEEASGYG